MSSPLSSHVLNKNRVHVGSAPHLSHSGLTNLKSKDYCVEHTLTKDQYGREVGDYGVKRYQFTCSELDSVQHLQGVMDIESQFRPDFSNMSGVSSDGSGLARDRLGFEKTTPAPPVVPAPSSPYLTPGTNMRLVPDNHMTSVKPVYNKVS